MPDITYTINPHLVPPPPASPTDPANQHHHHLRLGVAATAAALIIGLSYVYFAVTKEKPLPATQESRIEDRLLAVIREANVQVTQEDVDRMLTQLSGNQVKVTDQEKDSVLLKLQNKN